jgi:hypothetical protein
MSLQKHHFWRLKTAFKASNMKKMTYNAGLLSASCLPTFITHMATVDVTWEIVLPQSESAAGESLMSPDGGGTAWR